jgi:hypothetical protein
MLSGFFCVLPQKGKQLWQNTVPVTMTGATFALSASLPVTYDAAGYAATTMVYTVIGNIENFGNHGVSAQINTFTPCDTGEIQKAKGSKDYGTKSLTLAHVPSDAGQALLDTAAESSAHYSAKLTYPSGRIHYLDVLVSKHENQDGGANDTQKIGVDLAVCRKPVKVAAV